MILTKSFTYDDTKYTFSSLHFSKCVHKLTLLLAFHRQCIKNPLTSLLGLTPQNLHCIRQ